jgi:hypothetical protein
MNSSLTYGELDDNTNSEEWLPPLRYQQVSLPLLVRAAYGPTPPKLVVVLRDPADRLHAAFWRQKEYTKK